MSTLGYIAQCLAAIVKIFAVPSRDVTNHNQVHVENLQYSPDTLLTADGLLGIFLSSLTYLFVSIQRWSWKNVEFEVLILQSGILMSLLFSGFLYPGNWSDVSKITLYNILKRNVTRFKTKVRYSMADLVQIQNSMNYRFRK